MKKCNACYYTFSILLLVFIHILPSSVKAQKTEAVQDRKTLDSLLGVEHLDTLEGFPVTLYSDGFRVRARAIQALVQSCIRYYQVQFPNDRYAVQIEILNKKDWQTLPYPQPYGLPHFTDVNQSIIVSADKNALNHLNNQVDQNTNDSIIAGFDYVAVHELGHYFFYTLHQVNKEHWLNETMASYFLICYLQKNKLTLDLEKENAGYSPQHKTIEDFEKLYFRVGPQNYDWYQRRFIDLDFLLYPQHGNQLITYVLQNYGEGGKSTDAISLFKSLSPVTMKEWLSKMK